MNHCGEKKNQKVMFFPCFNTERKTEKKERKGERGHIKKKS